MFTMKRSASHVEIEPEPEGEVEVKRKVVFENLSKVAH